MALKLAWPSAPIVAVLGLAGCGADPFHPDLLSANGRDGGGAVPSYDSLMRIGTAARAGGDLPNALGVFRRASEMAPLNPDPLAAAGDVLLEMGQVNEDGQAGTRTRSPRQGLCPEPG